MRESVNSGANNCLTARSSSHARSNVQHKMPPPEVELTLDLSSEHLLLCVGLGARACV